MESSIQALGSIGKWIIEQERPDFGSCEKERHTLPMHREKGEHFPRLWTLRYVGQQTGRGKTVPLF